MSRHNDGEKQSMIAVSRGDKKRVGGFPHLEATRPLQGRFCGSPGRIRHTWTRCGEHAGSAEVWERALGLMVIR